MANSVARLPESSSRQGHHDSKSIETYARPIEAAAILGQYRECALRVATGGCQRFIVNGSGATMKFAKSEKEEKATEGVKDT